MIIIKRPVASFDNGRDGFKPVAIVNHITQGSPGSEAESAFNWFNNPANRVSSNYIVTKTGNVWEVVPPENTAWANGVVNEPDLTIDWLKRCVDNQTNPNSLTISIEHAGQSGENLTPAQYQATLELHKYLINRFNIQVDSNHIIGHNRIDGVNRPYCPGPAFPWQNLFRDLQSFNANPNNFSIGPGMITALNKVGKVAASAEQYYSGNPGQPPGLEQRSFVFTTDGGMLLALEKPDKSWEIRLYPNFTRLI